MSEVESLINIPVEHCSNIFGQFDEYAKVIEKTLKVTIIVRDSSVKVIGAEAAVQRASGVLNYLYELSKRGNQITRQNVDYSIAQSFEEKADSLIEIDSDTVCRTIAGRPIKPKTFGQKEYVDAIRDKMIVFGVGPAGTGKTYLAMAMAINAFKNNEVNKIILTRPAIEAGESLDSCREICRVRLIRILGLCMMHFSRLWVQRALMLIWKRSYRGCTACIYERTYT